VNKTLLAASIAAVTIIGFGSAARATDSSPSSVGNPSDAVVAFTDWATGHDLSIARVACFVDDTGLATCYGLADGLPVAYVAPPLDSGSWGEFTALATTPSSGDPEQGVMPNVVCLDLQLAQDTIQAAGVFYSRSEDASGEGRMQVMDRNWIVVAQDPAPGTPIGEGEAVLSVVKDDESNYC
jgi:hypothetical protein